MADQPIDQNTKNHNILCIEDQSFLTEPYREALNKAGYNINLKVDRQEGLELAKSNQYDVIMLNLQLPTMTGLEILRELRDSQQSGGIKASIVVTTNLEQRDDVREDIEEQAGAHLISSETKPDELVKLLNSLG